MNIPVHLKVNLSTCSFVEEHEEGGSKCAQGNSGEVLHLPVAVGTRLRKLTAISGFVHLREEVKERITWETHKHAWMNNTHQLLWLWQSDLMQEAAGLQVILIQSRLDYGTLLIRQFQAN